MTYRPAAVSQVDGSAFEFQNCLAAVGCMVLDRDTQGGKTSTPSHVRALTGDTSGGLTFPQVDYALRQIDGRDHLDFRSAISWATAMRMVDAGQGMGLIVNYGAIVDAGWNGNQSAGFRGSHGWYLNERRQTDHGLEDLIYDPLQDGRRPEIRKSPFWCPEWVVKRAAGIYAETGFVQAGFTRDTELTYHASFPSGAVWIYTVAGGVISSRIAKKFNSPTGAPCSSPSWYSWPGHTGRSLVKITAGYLAGKYVSRTYAEVVGP